MLTSASFLCPEIFIKHWTSPKHVNTFGSHCIMKENTRGKMLVEVICCRQENGSMRIPPMEISFGHQNMSSSIQVGKSHHMEDFCGNPYHWFSKCFPIRNAIIS